MIHKTQQLNWGEIAFLSTNSAYNLRSSQIYSILIQGTYGSLGRTLPF